MTSSVYHQVDPQPPGLTSASIPSACHPALVQLAERMLSAHVRGEDLWSSALTLADLLAFGLTPADGQLLLARDLIRLPPLAGREGRGEGGSRAARRVPTKLQLGPRSLLLLTDAGLAWITKQAQSSSVAVPSSTVIQPGEGVPSANASASSPPPAGAFSPPHLRSFLLPSYDADLRELSVAGLVILRLPVQGHNLAAVLKALESGGWKARVEKPLNGRPDGGDPTHLANAVYSLNRRQTLIDFRADGGAVRWQWRMTAENAKPPARAETKVARRRKSR